MKAVLLSIRPKWVELIASGKKTIEVRKSRPKLETPFKCYIYETKGFERVGNDNLNCVIGGKGRGAVVGEFVCDGIMNIVYRDDGQHRHYQWPDAANWGFFLNQIGVFDQKELKTYLDGKNGYGWHISALKMYEEPKELSELRSDCTQCGYVNARGGNCDFIIKRPPQSWCYVRCAT